MELPLLFSGFLPLVDALSSTPALAPIAALKLRLLLSGFELKRSSTGASRYTVDSLYLSKRFVSVVFLKTKFGVASLMFTFILSKNIWSVPTPAPIAALQRGLVLKGKSNKKYTLAVRGIPPVVTESGLPF